MDVLTRYKDRLVSLAEKLVAEETVEREAFEGLFADIPDPRQLGGPTPKPLDASPAAPRPVPAPPVATPPPQPSPSPA
jgi:hypothetical protein